MPAGGVRAENAVQVGVIGGERSARATEIKVETRTEPDGSQVLTITATLVIDDASGTNAGWQVAVEVIAREQPAEVTAGPLESPVLTEISSPVRLAGQAIDAAGGPKLPATSAEGDLGAPRVVLAANPGFGKGMYLQDITVVQRIPVGQPLPVEAMQLTVTITPAS